VPPAAAVSSTSVLGLCSFLLWPPWHDLNYLQLIIDDSDYIPCKFGHALHVVMLAIGISPCLLFLVAPVVIPYQVVLTLATCSHN
jgi:hypothetical protein